MGQETAAQLDGLVRTTEFFIAKLRRYTAGVNVEEMQWTPAGIANPLAWIVRHCADLLWLSYGRLAGEQIPANLGGSGIAWSAVKGATFDEVAQEPGPDAQERMAYLDRAWQTLKAYLQDHPGWEKVELVVEPTEQACQTYNRLSAVRRTVAALHLTC